MKSVPTHWSDPWKFKAVLYAIPPEGGQSQREALLHLVFPETFEDTVSTDSKAKIATAFAALSNARRARYRRTASRDP